MKSHPKYKFIDYNLNYGRHIVERFFEDCPKSSIVVDLGAGQGDDLISAQKIITTPQLYALETFPPYITHLENRGIKVFQCNLEHDKLPFDDESVDVIIMNQIMEHVKEVFWILHEVSRVLKVGGKFIVGVPNLAGFQNRLLLLVGRQPSTINNSSAHVRGYTKQDFTDLLETGFVSGYSLSSYAGSNFYPFAPMLARPLSRLFPNLSWAIFMKFIKEKPYEGNGYIKYPIEKGLETNFFLGNSQIL